LQTNKTGYLKFIFFLILPLFLTAQRLPKPEALTMQDGLGFRDLKAIAQDSRGLMWIGTTQGIERYDGQRFVKYGSDSQTDFLFPADNVSDENMLMVNDSSLWVLADEMLVELNLHTHKTTNLSETAGLKGGVFTLRQGADGTFWIVTDDGWVQRLLRYEGGYRFGQVATAKHLRMPFNDVAIDTAGNVWWSTNSEGLRQFSPSGRLLHEMKPDSIIWFGTKIYYTNISTDSRGRLFVFPKSKNGIWNYHPETGKYDVVAANLPAKVYSHLEDTRGNIWFAMYNGLLRWSPSGEWTDFTATLRSSLQFSHIRQLFEDRTHLLWVATDNGLLRLPIGRDIFQNHLTVPGAEWGNAMRGMFADREGRVYAFCENGRRGLHQVGNGLQKDRMLISLQDSLPLDVIMSYAVNFVFDKNENAAWTINDHLLKINMENHHCSVVESFNGKFSKVKRNPICLLKDGKILLGSELEHLTLYDPKSGQYSRFFSEGKAPLPSANPLVILEDVHGLIWVGTASAGLFCFNRKGELLAYFTTKTKPALGKDHVLSLHYDKSGKLWVGTFGGGLNCLELPANLSSESHRDKKMTDLRAKIFTQKDGLSDNNVVSILEDEEGNIWAATYNGLSCYRTSEGVFRNFYEEDGLSNNEFNYASFFKDEQGGMWFGGMNGLNYFDPKNILHAEKNPPLCLTGFTKYDSRTDSTLVQVIGKQPVDRFIISASDNWFQFNWALPNYFKPDKNHYYVRLEGLDEDWSYLGSTPFVRYNKLPHGNYVLHVKGSDSKGNWSESELAVSITVRPFFYQTWWFYLLVLALVGGIGYSISRARHFRLLEMERMRTRIASDLHDEVGSMLSGLSMQAELLEYSVSEKNRPRLHHISDISHSAVSKMRDLVWSIDSRRDKVKNLLDRMREQAADLLQPRDITCRFELGDLHLEKKLPVDVRQHIFLFFKEALNNVARHSNALEVNVRFGNFGGQFELSIHDNGSPKEKPAPATGLGLSNMELRAEKLGAKLEMKTDEGFLVKLTMKPI
jgi:ligand-binding sensor domain-containing protein/two-component sensor histidine kinase